MSPKAWTCWIGTQWAHFCQSFYSVAPWRQGTCLKRTQHCRDSVGSIPLRFINIQILFRLPTRTDSALRGHLSHRAGGSHGSNFFRLYIIFRRQITFEFLTRFKNIFIKSVCALYLNINILELSCKRVA